MPLSRRPSCVAKLRIARPRLLGLAIAAVLGGGPGIPAQAQDFPATLPLGDLDGSNGLELIGEAVQDRAGASVRTAGDINGDGIGDFVIGAYGAGTSAGRSYVVFGRNTSTSGNFPASIALATLDGVNGFSIEGAAAGDTSGGSVASAGDVNGDGIDDLLIGAPNSDAGGSNSGGTYVIFGRDVARQGGFPSALALSGLDGTNGFRITGAATSERSGVPVASAGDLNGDGIDDIAIGAPVPSSGPGRSYVVYGRDVAVDGPFPASLALSELNGSNGFRINAELGGDFSGRSLASAGDVNNDGIGDLIVGAPLGLGTAGRSYVLFGRDVDLLGNFPAIVQLADLGGSSGFKINGEVSGDRSGFSVAGAGDVNGDGVDDIVIGAYTASPSGTVSGRAYVVFGRDAASQGSFATVLNLADLNGSSGFKIDGEDSADTLGVSVASAGDLNGDGIDDLILGAPGARTNGITVGSGYVVFGRNTAVQGPFPAVVRMADLDGASGFELSGAAAFDQTGFDAAGGADINGDGVDDLLIGAPGFGYDTGRSFAVFGRITGTPGLAVDGAGFVNFSEVFVGTSSALQTITLTNPGSGLVSVDAIDLPDPAFAIAGGSCGPLPIRIRVGRSCTLELQFSPIVEGQVIGDMLLFGSSVTSPDSLVLLGTGVPAPLPELLPDPLDFGEVAVGDASVETVILENAGAGPLLPGGSSILGPGATEFGLVSDSCAGTTLAQGEFCGIEVAFAPGAPGLHEATLRINSNAPSGPMTVRLRGRSDVPFADGFE